MSPHEAFCIDSFQTHLLFPEDFLGDSLRDLWNVTGTGSAAVVDQQTGGVVRLTTGATDLDRYNIDWNNIRSLHVDQKATMELRVKSNQSTYTQILLLLRYNSNNYIGFEVIESGGGAANWGARTFDDGANTYENTGNALDIDYHIFRMESHTHGGNHIHYYMDNVETTNSPITTNVPDDATDYLQPYIYLRTRENSAKSIDVDYVVCRQEI